jgi:hypothetical protein
VNFAPHGPRLDTTYLCRALTSGGREQRGHSPINLNRRIGSLPQGALSEMEAAIQPARFNLPSNLPSIQNALIFGLRDWLIPPWLLKGGITTPGAVILLPQSTITTN